MRLSNSAAAPAVLFVDDEPMVVKTLNILFRRGYEVYSATGGQEGLEMIRRHKIDVVVSDQRMPGMSGTEMLHQVRELSPRTARILLTGYADLDAIQHSINKGEVYRFVTKPWDNGYMRKTVLEASQHARSAMNDAAIISESKSPDPLDELGGQPPGLSSQSSGVSILVIDDGKEVSSLVADIFGSNVRLFHAQTFREAARTLEQERVDIVLSEMFLKGVAMSELLHHAKVRNPAMMSIVISNNLDFNAIQNLINYVRVYRLFRKPVRRGMLKLSIQSALKQADRIRLSTAVSGYYSVDALGTA